MMLDPRLAQELKETHQAMRSDGRLPSRQQLQQYYDTFRARFGPEQLARLDGEALLEFMHGSGNRDSLAYWLEFKNDEEFPGIFGSIAGGSALKFGVYRSAQTGEWMSRDERNNPTQILLEQAVEIARKNRQQLMSGVELLEQLPPEGTDEEYHQLQQNLVLEAPDVAENVWGHKYFSLLFPDKLDAFHVDYFQRFHLIKVLQTPPEVDGRYACAGRFVGLAQELDIPVIHLTRVLNEYNGRPHKYWRVGTRLGENRLDIWPDDRDGGFIALGWNATGDLSSFTDANELREHLKTSLMENHGANASVAGRKANEIKRFVNTTGNDCAVGEIVIAVDGQTVLGIGRVAGDYEYIAESPFPHRRPVEWLSIETWKLADKEGLQTSFYQMRRNPENLVEIERRLFEARHAPERAQVPARAPASPSGKLDGIPGSLQSILDRKGQVILYGPPGTGKTYWAQRTARDLAAMSVYGSRYEVLEEAQKAYINNHYVRLCTFHPNYGYEDFLEGYRPELINEQLAFERRDGIFKELCQTAAQEPQREFFLIIDEINRGDIPRIFGELLTVLENDKRGMLILLPLSSTYFAVPKNVFIIGTMNTADRSIALLDTALRRRFEFLELMPDYDLLKDTAVAGIPLAPWLEALNRRIVEHVGRDARNLQIGHAYLMEHGKPVSSFSRFVRIMHEDIIPLLEEYCYEDYETLERILGSSLVNARLQTVRHELFTSARQDELVRALLEPSPEITTTTQAAIADQEAESDEDEDEDNGET